MAISLWGLMRYLDHFILDTSKTLNLVILTFFTAITGLLLYFSTCHFLKIKEQRSLFEVFKKFTHWQEFLKHSEEITELPPSS